MCPLCLSTITLLALGGGSASTLALLIGFNRKGNENGDDDRNDSSNRHS
jgi:hypothetical protein